MAKVKEAKAFIHSDSIETLKACEAFSGNLVIASKHDASTESPSPHLQQRKLNDLEPQNQRKSKKIKETQSNSINMMKF